MMKKRTAIILAVSTFLVGVLIGVGGTIGVATPIVRHLLDRWYLDSNAADAMMVVEALQHLHSGEQESALTVLEIKLDTDVIQMGSFLEEIPQSRRNADHLGILKLAREYRAKHPHKSASAEIDKNINRAFALVDAHP
jgi:hypothetical protein